MNTYDFAAKLRALANIVEKGQTIQGWITYQPGGGQALDVAAILRVGDGQGSMVIWGNPNIAPPQLLDAAQTALLALETAQPFIEKHEPCGYYCDEDVGHVDHPIGSTVGAALHDLRRALKGDFVDARLIAAAPQMRDALEATHTILHSSTSLLYCWYCGTTTTFSGDGTIPNPISHPETCILRIMESALRAARGEEA